EISRSTACAACRGGSPSSSPARAERRVSAGVRGAGAFTRRVYAAGAAGPVREAGGCADGPSAGSRLALAPRTPHVARPLPRAATRPFTAPPSPARRHITTVTGPAPPAP